MYGSLSVDSELKKGSTFTAEILVGLCTPAEISPNQLMTSKRLMQLDDTTVCAAHVLVAEDNRINQVLIRRVLEKFEVASVTVVDDGAQCLQTFQDNPHQFNIILLDCQMPVMDGYQAARQIRLFEHLNSLKRIPIVALTASAMKEDIQTCFAAGMDSHISKPFSQQDIFDTILKYLHRQ